jgi:hypothetical protein
MGMRKSGACGRALRDNSGFIRLQMAIHAHAHGNGLGMKLACAGGGFPFTSVLSSP